MSFDSSRFTFDPWKDFGNVVMPQGRVQLDSDWNEWLAELARRIRAGTLDTMGRAVYPSTTPNAFLITPTAGSISIGVGRMYVDGLLAENHGLPAPQSGGWIPPNVTPAGAQPAWDPALDELVGQNPIDYTQQPYYPNAKVLAPFPTSGGPYLIYLDVWLREVTFLEDPDLIEKAVGVDTTGRLQTVWQVKWLDVSSAGSVTCNTKDSDIGPWETLIQPSAGRLTTGVVQSTPSGPCCLAPNTGYTGMENQLYRVEIHQPGTPASTNTYPLPSGSTTATFKWSRDNASVATPVTGIGTGGTVLTVQSTGKDSVLTFAANDWVEITDDWLELNGQHGELHQVELVTAPNTIQLYTAVSSSNFPVTGGLTDPTRHTRVTRWDQQGKIFQSDGTTLWVDLGVSGSTGDIPVPPPGTALLLENGVTVSFDLNPSTGEFHVADYWNFAARTVDGTVENLVEAPPRGIHHHYARLSVFTPPSTAPDCRIEWPPQGGGCDCGSCVTAQSHNDGSWTIQNGIDAVQAQGGGKVCLGPGIYNITATINIQGAQQPIANITICGHGLPTLQPTAAFQASSIMLIEDSIDIAVDGIAFAGGATANPAGLISFSAVAIQKSAYVRVQNCSFGLVTDALQLFPAIGFQETLATDCAIRDNLFNNVRIGIGLLGTDNFLLTRLSIEDNQMFCTDGAVYLSGRDAEALMVSEILFARNFVQSTSGFVLSGQGLDVTIEDNTFSIIAATSLENGPYDGAVVCNISETHVTSNQIGRAVSTLTVSGSGNQGLPAGTYSWVVTALDVSGRELLITLPASLTLSTAQAAQLQWAAVVGATGYNVYRTVQGGAVLMLDAKNVPLGSTATVSYTDTNADSTLQTQLPAMQNDGIVLGSATSSSLIADVQVTGNQISGLIGAGILSPTNASLLEAIISSNQILELGGNGIQLNGAAVDIDIVHNALVSVGQLGIGEKIVSGIQLPLSANANLSENRIENLGPATGQILSAIYIIAAGDARIAGNLIAGIGPTTTDSEGILAIGLNRLDITDNNVRRASTVPTQTDQSTWLALVAECVTANVQGNLLESYGGNLKSTSPATVEIATAQSCTFSNNQCFLDEPTGTTGPLLVVGIQAQSVIAMGNLVNGPNADRTATRVSMALTVPAGNIPPVTVIGNITTMGISVNNAPIPTAMQPLNVIG